MMLKRRALAILIGLALPMPLAHFAQAAAPFVGSWDMALDNTNRQCRVMLRDEPGQGGKVLAMPMGCRRAMPILTTATAWHNEADHLSFADMQGKPLLDFAWANDHSLLVAKGPDGESYRMQPAGTIAAPAAMANGLGSGMPGTIQPVAQKPVVLDPPPAAPPPSLAGRYAVLRDPAKPATCSLQLDTTRNATGANQVTLAKDCGDPGLKIFDPVGWKYEEGRLTLIARRGHLTMLIARGDGSFSKDGSLTSGAPLTLKKQ